MESGPVDAVWLDPRRSRGIPARLWVNTVSRAARAENQEGRRTTAPVAQLKISSRVGHTRRTMGFPDGVRLIVADNDALDRALAAAGMGRRAIHRLESGSLAAVVLGVCLSVGVLALLAVKAVPVAAEAIAWKLPVGLLDPLGEQALEDFSVGHFRPSALTRARHDEVRALFRKVAADLPGERPHRLEIRRMVNGTTEIPAAFAFPQGVVLLSDRLVDLAESDDEIIGVVAHEIEHIRQRHILRSFVEGSLLNVLLELALGGYPAIPGGLTQMKYSRDHEREADCLAYRYMDRQGLDTGGIGRILARIEAELDTSDADPEGGDAAFLELLEVLSTHPSTEARSDPGRFCEDYLADM